jgi:hypothetical protein
MKMRPSIKVPRPKNQQHVTLLAPDEALLSGQTKVLLLASAIKKLLAADVSASKLITRIELYQRADAAHVRGHEADDHFHLPELEFFLYLLFLHCGEIQILHSEKKLKN